MRRVLPTVLAELAQLNSVLERLLILAAEIIDPLARAALHFYHVVLGHTVITIRLKD